MVRCSRSTVPRVWGWRGRPWPGRTPRRTSRASRAVTPPAPAAPHGGPWSVRIRRGSPAAAKAATHAAQTVPSVWSGQASARRQDREWSSISVSGWQRPPPRSARPPMKSPCQTRFGSAASNRSSACRGRAGSGSRPWRRRIPVTVLGAGTVSHPSRSTTGTSLRPPQAGWASRRATTAASTAGGVRPGLARGRRERSASSGGSPAATASRARSRHCRPVGRLTPNCRHSALRLAPSVSANAANRSRCASTVDSCQGIPGPSFRVPACPLRRQPRRQVERMSPSIHARGEGLGGEGGPGEPLYAARGPLPNGYLPLLDRNGRGGWG